MVEIHICPIFMRTVRFEDGSCLEECEDRSDCPVMGMIKDKETE